MASFGPVGSSFFYKIAGVSGFLATALAAYGSHAPSMSKPEDKNFKEIFMTGNRMHFLHTLMLLAVPLTNRPQLTGSLVCAGMLLFSGSCYLKGLTKNKWNGRLAPVGGFLLMGGWLSLLLP